MDVCNQMLNHAVIETDETFKSIDLNPLLGLIEIFKSMLWIVTSMQSPVWLLSYRDFYLNFIISMTLGFSHLL